MDIIVTKAGELHYQGRTIRCALGKGGMCPEADKVEGDGATPAGRYPLHRVLYRADRVEKPETALPVAVICPDDGWCDAPDHPDYNKQVHLPFSASHEVLYRDDHIYDIIVVLGHNDHPPKPNKGSAIFFHLARENFEPTQGCIAITLEAMRKVLKAVRPGDMMDIRL